MDIDLSIEKMLFVTDALIRRKPGVEKLNHLRRSLEDLKYKWQQKRIDQQLAAQNIFELQKQFLLHVAAMGTKIKTRVEDLPVDKTGDLIDAVYKQLVLEGINVKTKRPTGVVSKLISKFMQFLRPKKNSVPVYPELNEAADPFPELDTMLGPEVYRGQTARSSGEYEALGSEPVESQTVSVPAPAHAAAPQAQPVQGMLPPKGKILYDIPDIMQVNQQQKCLVRIAKDELTVKDDDSFSAAAKVEDIVLSGVMKVELIDIADPPRFNIKTISSSEQEVDTESYTEWLFWVTPLSSGIHDLILKVSVIKMIDGKERRKDLVFQKAINISSGDAGSLAGNQFMTSTPDEASNGNMKNLADEKNVAVVDPPAVFISYAHKDKVYFDIFSESLRSQSGWNIWTDRNIEIGKDWFTRIRDSIKDSDFAVLLVSADFISSGFIKQHEFDAFMQLEKSRSGFAFLPVLLRDVDFTRWKGLAALQFFVAYGDEYGVPELKAKMIPFAKLCRFDNNNQLIPNDNIDTYFKNFVAKVEKDWLRHRKN